jgi:Tol biopolymer transport system component
VYHVHGVATRGANMAVRILLVLAVVAIFYGCGQSSSSPEQDEKAGAESKSVTPSAPAQQETIQEESTQQETTQQETTERSSEAAKIFSVGRCADNGSTDRQQEGRGEAANGKIAFTRMTIRNRDIFVIDEEGDHQTRLTHGAAVEGAPLWSPDGEKLAFVSVRIGPGYIYVINTDGTNETRLTDQPLAASENPPAWSPDGRKIAFVGGSAYVGDIYVINTDGTNETRLTRFNGETADQTYFGRPAWSPDGSKIAFFSTTITSTYDDPDSSAPATAPAEGLTGIYLINVDGTGLCKLTSIAEESEGEAAPTWSPTGNKIAFYEHNTIYSINPDGTGRKELTGNMLLPTLYVWSPDGEKIAFIKQSDLYVINADGRGLRRLTNTPGPSSEALPTWAPDSEKIAFSCPLEAEIDAHTDLCVINADGTGWKRIASNVADEGIYIAASWGSR